MLNVCAVHKIGFLQLSTTGICTKNQEPVLCSVVLMHGAVQSIKTQHLPASFFGIKLPVNHRSCPFPKKEVLPY